MQWWKEHFRRYRKIRGKLLRRIGEVKTCVVLEQVRNREIIGGGKMSERSHGSVWNQVISTMGSSGIFLQRLKSYSSNKNKILCVLAVRTLCTKCVQENTKNVSWTVVRIMNIGRCRENEKANRDILNKIIDTW